VRAGGFGADRRDPPGIERTWAREGWLGRKAGEGGGWASLSFSLIPKFLIPFYFIFSFGFIFKHATNSNLNIPNMCIRQKNNLGST
jgi:hypothetical protein